MNKKFAHTVGQLKRNVEKRKPRLRFLLSFEDAKSAPSYFHSLIKCERISPRSVINRCAALGTDPKSVVDAAVDAEKQLGSEEFCRAEGDQVWIVIDVDEHPGLSNTLERCRQKKYNVALSNPCFEYWLLLHFEESAPGVNNCSEMISRHLKHHIKKYTKGGFDFSEVVKSARKASARAGQQHRAKNSESPQNCCPSTTIYKLIDELLKQNSK